MELTFERKGGESAFVDKGGGGSKPQGKITIALDGYSAPVTAGNFAVRVAQGAFDGAQVKVTSESILAAATDKEGERIKAHISYVKSSVASQ